MGLVAIPYWQTKQLYGIERHYSEIRRMLPRLQSYLAGDRSWCGLPNGELLLLPVEMNTNFSWGLGPLCCFFMPSRPNHF